MKNLKHKVILKNHQKIIQRIYEASFIYDLVQNEAIFVIEKIIIGNIKYFFKKKLNKLARIKIYT